MPHTYKWKPDSRNHANYAQKKLEAQAANEVNKYFTILF